MKVGFLHPMKSSFPEAFQSNTSQSRVRSMSPLLRVAMETSKGFQWGSRVFLITSVVWTAKNPPSVDLEILRKGSYAKIKRVYLKKFFFGRLPISQRSLSCPDALQIFWVLVSRLLEYSPLFEICYIFVNVISTKRVQTSSELMWMIPTFCPA